METLRGAWRAVRAEASTAYFVDFAEHLAPGRWVAIPPNNMVWHHVDAEVPSAMFEPGGKAAASALRGDNSWSTRRQWAKRTAYRSALRLAGSRRWATVPAVGEGQGNATVVVKVNGSRAEVVALSPGERAVYVGRAGSFDEDYVEVRRRFERYLPAPAFSVSDDGALLVERWCEGPLFRSMPAEQRLPHVLSLLEGYASLAAAEAVTRHASPWQEFPRFLDRVVLPGWLSEPLADDRVRCLLESPLLVPAQGGAGMHNVMLDAHDGQPRVIDFGNAGWHPVWLDPTRLAIESAGGLNGDAQRRYAALSAAVNRVWSAVGLDDVSGLTAPHWSALRGVGDTWFKTAIRPLTAAIATPPRPDPQKFAERAVKCARAAPPAGGF